MRSSLMNAAHASVGGAWCRKSGTMGQKTECFQCSYSTCNDSCFSRSLVGEVQSERGPTYFVLTSRAPNINSTTVPNSRLRVSSRTPARVT